MSVSKDGNQYQYVQRCKNTAAVVIVGYNDNDYNQTKYQLILHKRPIFNKYIIQFPAGLIDPNQEVESAALRQLKEQTGWAGNIKTISPPMPSSAGLTTQLIHIVTIELRYKTQVEQNQQNQDIVILPLMTRRQIKQYISVTNYIVSSRVYCYFNQ